MDDMLFALAVILLGLGGVLGIAYALDERRRRRGPLGLRLPPAGRLGRLLWWGMRILAGLMVLSILGAYVLKATQLAWFACACLVLFFVDHTAYRVLRLTGK